MPSKPQKKNIIPFGARTAKQIRAQQEGMRAADALVSDILSAAAIPTPKEQELSVIIGQYRDFSLKLLNHAYPEAGLTLISPDHFFFAGLQVLVDRAAAAREIIDMQKGHAAKLVSPSDPPLLGFAIDGISAPDGCKKPDRKVQHWYFLFRGTRNAFYNRVQEVTRVGSKNWFLARVGERKPIESTPVVQLGELWARPEVTGGKFIKLS